GSTQRSSSTSSSKPTARCAASRRMGEIISTGNTVPEKRLFASRGTVTPKPSPVLTPLVYVCPTSTLTGGCVTGDPLDTSLGIYGSQILTPSSPSDMKMSLPVDSWTSTQPLPDLDAPRTIIRTRPLPQRLRFL